MSCVDSVASLGLFRIMNSFGLMSCIDKPTRVCHYHDDGGMLIRTTSTIIDNVFIDSLAFATSGVLRTDTSDHYTVFIILHPSELLKSTCKTVLTRPFTEGNVERFCHTVSQINWSPLYSIKNTDDAMCFFDTEIQSKYDDVFPLCERIINPVGDSRPAKKDNGWFTQRLLDMSRWKYHLYKKSKASGSKDDRTSYVNYKKLFEHECEMAKISYFSYKFVATKGDSSALWREINSNLGRKKKNGCTIYKITDQTGDIDTDPGIANALNSHFANVASTVCSSLPSHSVEDIDKYMPTCFSNCCFDFSPVSSAELKLCASGMRTDMSGFVTRCPSFLLGRCMGWLASPLSYIFNLTIQTSSFSCNLKHAIVTPIFKSGNRSDPNNYRPISVTRFISKLFERLYKVQMVDYLEKCNILSDSQFGFRRGRSCEMALLSLYERIVNSIDSKRFSVGIFIDIRKAFDCVPRQQLVRKLSIYGFSKSACSLILSFLTDRTQQTVVNSTSSSTLPVNCGLPQGTVLGPVLFVLYVNDLLEYLRNKTSLCPTAFADDTNLFHSNDDVDNAIQTINIDLVFLVDWFTRNRLVLNADKTQYMVFQPPQSAKKFPNNSLMIGNVPLVEASNVKCLGVTLSSNLSWKPHVDNICSKLSYVVAVLYRLMRAGVPRRALIPVYRGLFLPHINYCSLLWGAAGPTIIKPLQILQNKIIRIIFQLPSRSHVDRQLSIIAELSVSQRLQFSFLKFIHDTIFGHVPNFLNIIFSELHVIHNHNTRSAVRRHLFRDRVRTQIAERFVANHSLLLWNALPTALRDTSSSLQFQALLREFLLSGSTVHL
jgi:hypothetical protein